MKRKQWFARWLALGALVLTLLPLTPGTAGAAPGVDPIFRVYYDSHQGMRVLGAPLTALMRVQGYAAQYFEKGRLEDHRAETTNPDWAFMYGRLSAELMELDPQGAVSGARLTYGDLQEAAQAEQRVLPPAGFRGGTMPVEGGRAIFVPYDAALRPAPGQVVPLYFWTYLNRADLFHGGWLHDVGLPMTSLFGTSVTKEGQARGILVQAFERAVLTYDPQNPAAWQVERANIGSDAMRTPPLGGQITSPAAGAQVMLPLHLLARVGQPGERVTASLTWQDGTVLRQTFSLLSGTDGQGLLAGNLDWLNLPQPPEPRTQPATLELHNAAGVLVAQCPLTIVSPRDANTQEILVYWTISGTDRVGSQPRRVIKTPRIGTAALEELLWGPPAISQVGYGTALPTPEQVLAYPGRAPDWGPRVTLRSLTVENGVATADFSRELRAYGGGSLRVKLIRDQITQTLRQFATVREVRIAIEGQTDGVLEP
jgi:hypothetical protein